MLHLGAKGGINMEYILSKFSHELRNPLTSVYSTVQLIETMHPEVKEFKYWSNISNDLEYMNRHSVQGLRPCYLQTDSKNKFLVSAGYYDGKLTVSRINPDGTVGEVTDEVFMKTAGSVISRNNRCHVNCALFTPDEKYILAVDLGVDQIKVYNFDHRSGKISLKDR